MTKILPYAVIIRAIIFIVMVLARVMPTLLSAREIAPQPRPALMVTPIWILMTLAGSVGLVAIILYKQHKAMAGTTWLKASVHPRYYEETCPRAIDADRESLTLKAHHFITWTHLAHAYFRVGKERLAEDACAKALTFPPLDPDCVKLLRSLCQLLGIESASLDLKALLNTGEQLFSRRRIKFAREVFFAAFEATIPESPLEAQALQCLNKCAERNGHLIKSGIRVWVSRLLACLLVGGGAWFGFYLFVEILIFDLILAIIFIGVTDLQ